MHPCLGLPWVPEGFFLLFAAKIERQSRDHHDRCFAAQCSPQTTRKKPYCTQGTLGSEAPTKKYKNAGRRERYPGVPETFLARFPVSVKSRLRRSWLRPTAEDVSTFGQHRKFPKIPAAREKNLWYPGYANACFLCKQKAGKCYKWHIEIDRNISCV